MQLTLNVTYPNRFVLEIEVPDFTVVDRSRVSDIDGLITVRRTFGSQNIVPDVDRYRLRSDGTQFLLRAHPVCEVSPCSNRYYDLHPEEPNIDYSKTIVVVLESPHRDEYLRNLSEPIAPAQGKTGSNLQDHLGFVLRTCPTLYSGLEGDTRVVLANPVQFQTSLVSIIRCPGGFKPVRDAVWRGLWNHQLAAYNQNGERQTTNDSYPIRDCFEARLGDLAPDYIINACTSETDTMKEMKESVNSFLANNFPSCKRYEVGHPSSWFSEDNRKLYRR